MSENTPKHGAADPNDDGDHLEQMAQSSRERVVHAVGDDAYSTFTVTTDGSAEGAR
jgi:hypothetical protein